MKPTGKAKVLLISGALSFGFVHWLRSSDDGSLTQEASMTRRPAPGSWLQFEALREALKRAQQERELAKRTASVAPVPKAAEKGDTDDVNALLAGAGDPVDDADESQKKLNQAASRLNPYQIEFLGRWIASRRADAQAKVAAALVLSRSPEEANQALKAGLHHNGIPQGGVPGSHPSGHTTGAPIVVRTMLDTVVQSGGSSPETARFLEHAESEPGLQPVHGYVQQLQAAVAANDVKGHYERQDQALRRIAGEQ